MIKLHVITCARGIGRSTAIATYPPVNEIDKLLILDTEDSQSDNLHMGFRHIRMFDRFKPDTDMLQLLAAGRPPWVSESQKASLVEYYDYLIHILNTELQPGKYKYLGIDTIGPIEAAMVAAVESNRQVFGWSGQMAYGRRETEGVRPLYTGLLEAISRRGIETILIASHLKNPWVDNAPVMNKVKPSGRLKVLMRLATGAFWLVPGSDASGAPAALVLKARIGKIEPGEDGRWSIQRVLPERMPIFTWSEVDQYRENPANHATPASGETMSQEEKEMISELLSEEAMKLMIMRRQEKLGSGHILAAPSAGPAAAVAKSKSDNEARAISMLAESKSRSEIIAVTGLNIADIVKLERGTA